MPRTGPTSETLRRQWTLLALIPRAPRKIDSARLERLLDEQGIELTRRSIQRTLESLSQQFVGLRCDDRSKPFGWCWDAKAALLEIPGMSLGTAVTYQLLERHLASIMPRSTIESLRPHFRRAQDVLRQQPDAKMSRWSRKVRVVAAGQQLLVPNVSDPVLRAVYGALLEDRRLNVRYRKRGDETPRDYEVSPLGLVLREGHLILVGTFWDYDDVNQMVLHRIQRAEADARRARPNKSFDLDAFIASGAIGFRKSEEPVALELRVQERLAVTLRESRLSDDQRWSSDSQTGFCRLAATVADTVALRTWLRGHGAAVEVLAPAHLRDEMAEESEAVAALYC
jgi:predicted DNA-binding transcriptional regulator YafY